MKNKSPTDLYDQLSKSQFPVDVKRPRVGDNGTQIYLLPLSLYSVEKMRSNFTHSSVFKFETRQGMAQIRHD